MECLKLETAYYINILIVLQFNSFYQPSVSKLTHTSYRLICAKLRKKKGKGEKILVPVCYY